MPSLMIDSSTANAKTRRNGGRRARELLQLVGGVRGLVHQHVVVRGARGALDARVAVQEEAKLHRMHDRLVHHRAWRGAQGGCITLSAQQRRMLWRACPPVPAAWGEERRSEAWS